MLTLSTLIKTIREPRHHFGDSSLPTNPRPQTMDPSRPGELVRRWSEEKGAYVWVRHQ